jgi:hypothetical protein
VLLDSPLDCSSCVLPMESDNPYHFVLTHEGKHLFLFTLTIGILNLQCKMMKILLFTSLKSNPSEEQQNH